MFNRMGEVNRQKGFTLVEVLTVMLVMAAMASVTVQTASTLAFQGRDEVTKDRYAKIKAAILGNPAIVVNSQPNISGFVSDVGRLPINIHELLDITNGYCPNRWKMVAGIKKYYDTSDFADPVNECNTDLGAGSWITRPSGWNGPYLTISTNPLHDNAFPDGWGNVAPAANNHNYGWYYSLTDIDADGINEVSLQSYGKDQTGGGTALYDVDYPSNPQAINENDWTVNANGISAMILASSIAGTCAPSPWIPTDPTVCTLTGGIWDPTPPSHCAGSPVLPTSKLGCQSVAGTWTDSPSNLCIKITSNSHDYISEGTLPTILEDGLTHLVNFTSVFYDADSDFVKDPGEDYIPIGNVSIGIYSPDCTSSLPYHPICINTNNNLVNFTEANCKNAPNNGTWINNGSEQYCLNLSVDTACTGTTSPQLGGTFQPKINVTLAPNSSLPTINW